MRKSEHDELCKDLTSKRSELKTIEQELTNVQIDEKLKSLTTQRDQLKAAVDQAQGESGPTITEEDLKRIEADHDKYLQQWKSARKGCLDMIDAASESMDMNRKEFITYLDLETDEDYGLEMP